MESMHSDKETAQLLVQVLRDRGVSHIVISPGSRNAPLVIELFNRAYFTLYSIVDERSAAFFALGLAQQLQQPVAVCCTSGSAVLNYYPAVAEAFYQQLSLVVLSADRPRAFVDQGMGQTIRQENVLASHVLQSVNLERSALASCREVAQALDRCKALKRPIHINLPFDEPLYKQTTQSRAFAIPQPEIHIPELDSSTLDDFIEKWNASVEKMVILGVLFPSVAIQRFVQELARDPSVVVLSETTSNIRVDPSFGAIDQLVFPFSDSDFRAYAPEVLLCLGTNVISKKIKSLLRNNQPVFIGQVGTQSPLPASFGEITHPFRVDFGVFAKRFVQRVQVKASSYRSDWDRLKKYRLAKHQAYLKKVAYSDLKAMEILLDSIPDGYQLQLGNSAIVRYAQLFKPDPSLRVFANRGTSGIDGSTSTALGAAWCVDLPTIFISGDMGFFYDSNALWIKYVRPDMRIAIVNNGGGGIFKFVSDLGDSAEAAPFFTTPHTLDARHLAAMHDYDYQAVSNAEELNRALDGFYHPSDRPKLLEVFTQNQANEAVLKAYFSSLR
ncbi:MAG: 2-succinyl-5-enolpyruvyl-6-hydroxy-3-cyclohexene-1-carboxylic-acid synthase [Flavobacteriales bacterium]